MMTIVYIAATIYLIDFLVKLIASILASLTDATKKNR